MIIFKVLLLLYFIISQLHAVPKFQPISSVNIRPTTTWIPGPNNNKYQFHIGWQSWLSAREYCLSQDADLVSINSDNELQWILKHYANDIAGVGERHIQIGLYLPSSNSSDWIWVDKTNTNYSFMPFDGSIEYKNGKKCANYLINKKIVQPMVCDVSMNLPDKPVRFICERSKESHLAMERANNPLWDKFDKILQFLGISDGNSVEGNSKKKGKDKTKDDYYSDDSEYDSREFDKDKNGKNDVVLLTFIDSKDPKNLNVTKEIDNEGSGDGMTNDFENIMTRKSEDTASSTPKVKTTKSIISEISNMVDGMKQIIKLGLDDDKLPSHGDDPSDEYNIYSRLGHNQDSSLKPINDSPKLNIIPQKSHPIINKAIKVIKTLDSFASDYNDDSSVDYQFKDDKIDRRKIDEGNKKLVQSPKSDGMIDKRIIGDNLIPTTSKLTTVDDITKNNDITEGSGEDIVKVNNQKNDRTLSIKDHSSNQRNNIPVEKNKIEEVNGNKNPSSLGQVDDSLVNNNIEIKNVEEKIIKFFKVLYEYLQKSDVRSLKEILDDRESGVSIIDHLKKSLNATTQREISQIKALEKLYNMGVNLEKVRHDAINTTMDHYTVKMAILEIEKELTDELVNNMSEEFDEVNNLSYHNTNKLKGNKSKNLEIVGNTTATPKQTTLSHSNTTPHQSTTKKNTKKNKPSNNKGINSRKNKKNRKNKKGILKKTPKVIGTWHPEVPPTERQRKEFAELEKSRVKLNNDTYEIFKNFNENERTRKLLERIHQHELEKKKSSEKEAFIKVTKDKSQETTSSSNNHNDVDGLMNLVTKTDKTVHKFIDKHNQ
uniref:C-type lectin domain-containing protein n=1 Tax=Strongyloides venezuelensis TaxID=75913 RepID=A0A0K0FIM0_STRVS